MNDTWTKPKGVESRVEGREGRVRKWWAVKWRQLYLNNNKKRKRKQYGISSKKLKMQLPFDPVIPLLGLYPKNPESPIQNVHPNVHSSVIYNSQVLETD